MFGILVGKSSSPDIGSRFDEMTGAVEARPGARLTRSTVARTARAFMFRVRHSRPWAIFMVDKDAVIRNLDD